MNYLNCKYLFDRKYIKKILLKYQFMYFYFYKSFITQLKQPYLQKCHE